MKKNLLSLLPPILAYLSHLIVIKKVLHHIQTLYENNSPLVTQ